MPYGLNSHVSYSLQDSYGTATASWHSPVVVAESISYDIATLRSEGMRKTYERAPAQQGMKTVQGELEIEPHPEDMGYWLRLALGSYTTTYTGSIGAGGLASHVFAPATSDVTPGASALPPFTLQVDRDATSAWLIRDNNVRELELSINAGEALRAKVGIVGTNVSTVAPTTPVYLSGNMFSWDGVTLTFSDAANNATKTLSVKINNNISGKPLINGTKNVARLSRDGRVEVDITGTMMFDDLSEYNVFLDGTERSAQIKFTSPIEIATGSAATLTVDIPCFRYETFPLGTNQAGEYEVAFGATAEYSLTSSYSVQVTLVNTVENYNS